MSVPTHPDYDERLPEWQQMEDTHCGERAVKTAGQRYLPATAGMVAEGCGTAANSEGQREYDAYRGRAVFPELVAAATNTMIGVMHAKPPKIELPSLMEPMRQSVTGQGESLDMLLRRINTEQLIYGRLGLLADLPRKQVAGVALPYLSIYKAPDIPNWVPDADDNLVRVVLDESEAEVDPENLKWAHKEKYRILSLTAEGSYVQGLADADSIHDIASIEYFSPQIASRTHNRLPFAFINASDIVTATDKPPLLSVSNGALTIYRGEADYRYTLFMQGQETFVVTGASEEDTFVVGANQVVKLHDTSAKAQYVGVSASGLAEQRAALENDYARASQRAGEMIDSVSRERESGHALKIRVSARTATLNQVAITGAFGLESVLKEVATWAGANPEEVAVTPNLDFASGDAGGAELGALMAAKAAGAPISLRSVHDWMKEKELSAMTIEEEVATITDENKKYEVLLPKKEELSEEKGFSSDNQMIDKTE